MSSPDPQGTLRQNLIDQAVDFLTDPRIIKSPDDKKRRYLKSKGLTDDEINAAFDVASSCMVYASIFFYCLLTFL